MAANANLLEALVVDRLSHAKEHEIRPRHDDLNAK